MMQRTNNDTEGAPRAACASCKHQRKKCDENCILAPFFSAENTRDFQAVHKVFGVSNIQKMIKSVDEKDRKRAADSLVWEACWRQKDPILGPYGEYTKILDELKLYRSSGQCYQQQPIMQAIGQDGLAYKSPSSSVVQTFGQDGLAYKSPSSSVGWNGNSGMTNKGRLGSEVNDNNGLNYIHNNMVNSSPYTYPSKQNHGDDVRIIVPLQPNSINGYNSPYYLPDRFSPLNGTTMESTMWEHGS